MPVLGWSLFKPLLKCFLGKDGEKKEDETSEEDKGGSRSNHQRLQAVEMVGTLIKGSMGNKEATESLAKNMKLMTSVLIKVIETADSW